MFDYPVYPLTMFHPVLRAVTVQNQEEAMKTFVPAHDWHKTPEEADAHRTLPQAEMVAHNTTRMMVDALVDRHAGVAPDVNVHSASHTENMPEPGSDSDDDKMAENEAVEQAALDRQAAAVEAERRD